MGEVARQELGKQAFLEGSLSRPSLRQGLCLPDLILAPHLPFNPSLNLTFPSVNGDNNNNIFVV